MPEYKITDQTTGKSLKIAGDSPPSEEAIAQIFSQYYSTQPRVAPRETQSLQRKSGAGDYAMEAIAGFNRPFAWLADRTLMAPINLYRQAVGKEPIVIERYVGQRGDFAGDSALTDIAAATGEVASLGFSGGSVNRFIASYIDDAVRNRGNTLQRVLSSLGQSTPRQDITLGAVSGAGGEVAAQVFDESPGEARVLGQVLSPLAWATTAQALMNTGRNIINAGAPSINEIRGASRAHYALLEDAGVKANGPSTNRMVSQIRAFIADQDLELNSPSATTELNRLFRIADEGNVTYSTLIDAASRLRSIPRVDNAGRLASDAANLLDDIIYDMVPANPESIGGLDVQDVLGSARELWRRAKVANILENMQEDAIIASEAAKDKTIIVSDMRKKLSSLIQSDSKNRHFFTDSEIEKIREVVKGEPSEIALIKLGELIGFNSNDLIRSAVFGSIGSVAGSYFGTAGGVGGFGGGIIAGAVLRSALQARANKIFRNNATYMQSMIRSGRDGEAIAKLYLQNVPAPQRDAADLTALLLNSNADLRTLAEMPIAKTPIVADSLILAIPASRMMREEKSEQNAR